MALDPTTNIGKVRLRVADISDLPILPDSVYESALEDTDNNLPAAAKLCANYILGVLSMKTHKKMAQMEVWGGEAFSQYKDFLLLTLTNPAFMDYTALPYLVTSDKASPIKAFTDQWNCVWDGRTVNERLEDITGYPYGDNRPGEV